MRFCDGRPIDFDPEWSSNPDPLLLPDLFQNVSIIFHRGDQRIGPENTLASFDEETVTSLGEVEFTSNMHFGFELDVWGSKDGVPVVIHSKKLGKVIDGSKGTVKEFSASDLQKMRVRTEEHGIPSDDPKLKIPTLEDVLRLTNCPLLIEIKDRSIVAAVVNLLQQDPEVMKRVMLQSFNRLIIFDILSMDPSIPVVQLTGCDDVSWLRPRLQDFVSSLMWQSAKNSEASMLAVQLNYERRRVIPEYFSPNVLFEWTVRNLEQLDKALERAHLPICDPF